MIFLEGAITHGYTALHVACEEGHTAIVELLLAAPGLDMNAVNAAINGVTALDMARRADHAAIVQLLEGVSAMSGMQL